MRRGIADARVARPRHSPQPSIARSHAGCARCAVAVRRLKPYSVVRARGGGAPRRGSGQRKALKSREATAPGCFCILAAVLSQSHSLCKSATAHVHTLGSWALCKQQGQAARPTETRPRTSQSAVAPPRGTRREKKKTRKNTRDTTKISILASRHGTCFARVASLRDCTL